MAPASCLMAPASCLFSNFVIRTSHLLQHPQQQQQYNLEHTACCSQK